MADTSPAAPGQSPAPPPASPPSGSDAPAAPPVVVKKYANRRLYNTETSSYITLDNLAEMIRAGRNFAVYDAKSGDDITRGVLTQIIVEEESKGSAMLPTAFLRQLIGFYGGNLQGVVPRYLEYTMSSFARQQQQVRQMMERTISPFLPMGMEEMNRQNLAMFDRALSLWNPFLRTSEPESGGSGSDAPTADAPTSDGPNSDGPVTDADPAPDAPTVEIERLKAEIESLRHQLAAAHAAAVMPATQTAAVPPSAPANVLSDPDPEAGNGSLKAGQRRPARGKPGVDTPVG